MAIFHVQAAYISKGAHAGGAVGFARYLERTDQDHATQHRRYLERDGHDADRDLVASGSASLPAWAKDAEHFWLMADRYERKNGVIARTVEIALPRELSDQGRVDLADDIRAALFEKYPHTWALHCPEVRTTDHAPADQREKEQPHLHIMFSPRREDAPLKRTPQQWFRQAAPEGRDPLSGGVRKDPVWDRKGTLQGVRYEVAVLTNAALEREGHAVAVSHESIRAQGHDRSPERVHARADAVLLKKYGWEIPAHLPQHQQAQLREMHDRWRATLATRETITRDYRGWENECARSDWHRQKEREGIRDLSREAVVDHVRDRFWQHDHSPVRSLEREESFLRAVGREYARTGRERPEPTVHAQTREREHKRTQGQEREPERDLTRVWERPLIGNRQSGIYHTPEHHNYGDVHPWNQERFWTENAAMEAGYRRAANDHYGPGSGQAREDPGGREHEHTQARTRLRQRLGLSLGGDRGDAMQHGVHVQLEEREHTR